MGWASGSELAEKVWGLFRPFIQEKDRKKVAKRLIVLFENEDCDTLDECEQLMFDARGEEK